MYKLLIVEDEKTIAQGIANGIPWAKWGFEISGICYNGLEALDFIEKDKPDIVLSDIRMPQMDGIALMQFLNKNYPEIKIIILSGYNDFEYLQMSIRSRVAEYLLKPTDVDEFEELFRRMKGVLDQEAEERLANLELGYDKKCNFLLKGYGYDEEKVEEEFYSRDTDMFGVALFRIDSSGSMDKALLYNRKILAARELNRWAAGQDIRGRFLCNYEEELTGLLCFDEEFGGDEAQILAYISDLMDAAEKKTGLTLFCGISNFYGDYRMLPQCYEQTKCSVSQSIFRNGDGRIFFYHQLREADFDYYQITLDEGKILKDILNQDEEALGREISATFGEFRDRTVKDYNYINQIAMEILFSISRKIMKYGVRPEKIMNENGFGYMDVFDRQSLEDKERFLLHIFRLFMVECQIQQGKYSKTSELARLIRKIVDEEYMSNLISLEYVAEKVHKNTAYISKIFKNEFECNFSTYVSEKRLEKSRELLADPLLKIYEISQRLGWADVSNYIKVFKKKYGVSPDEYRKALTRS